MSGIGETLFGGGSDPGVFGTGVYQTTPYSVDPNAFNFSNNSAFSNVSQQALQNMNWAQANSAPTAQAAQAGPVQQAQTAQAGPAAQVGQQQQVGAQNVGAAQINNAQSDQSRGVQQGLTGQLQQQAEGKGPSLATQQLEAGQQRSLANNLALAASQRGTGNGALAQRQLQQQQANQGAGLTAQAAAARTQEQLNAQNALAGLSTNTRAQDLQNAQAQAQLQQQAGLANQGANLAAAQGNQQLNANVALANAGAQNALGIQNAQLAQQANLSNAGMVNANTLANAQFNQQANLANQQAQLSTTQQQNAYQLANMGILQQQGLALQQGRMGEQQLNVNQQLGLQGIQAGAYANAAENRGQFAGMAMGAIGGAIGGAALMSDADAKADARKEGAADAMKYMQQTMAASGKGGKGFSSGFSKTFGGVMGGMMKGGAGGADAGAGATAGADPANPVGIPMSDGSTYISPSQSAYFAGQMPAMEQTTGMGSMNALPTMNPLGEVAMSDERAKYDAFKAGFLAGKSPNPTQLGEIEVPLKMKGGKQREKLTPVQQAPAGAPRMSREERMAQSGMIEPTTSPTVRPLDPGDYVENEPAQAPQAPVAPAPQRTVFGRPVAPNSLFGWMQDRNRPAPAQAPAQSQPSWSSERTITVEDKRLNGGKPTVIPSLWKRGIEPVQLSEDQAIEAAVKSKQKFPKFNNNEEADRFANDRERMWDNAGRSQAWTVPSLSSVADIQPHGLPAPGGGTYYTSDKEAKEFMDKSEAYSYRYKDPTMPGAAPGRHFGPMAQDLQKSEFGEQTVGVDPNTGYKVVHTGRLSLANTAALHNVNKRLSLLEKRVSKR